MQSASRSHPLSDPQQSWSKNDDNAKQEDAQGEPQGERSEPPREPEASSDLLMPTLGEPLAALRRYINQVAHALNARALKGAGGVGDGNAACMALIDASGIDLGFVFGGQSGT